MADNVEKKVLINVEIKAKQKKEPLFSDSFGLVAEAGFEPTTFGL